jgi:hypothetical protein
MHRFSFVFLIAASLAGSAGAVPASGDTTPSFVLELEGGALWQSRNDVQIPNDETGTRFSLVDIAGSGPWPAGRVYATWNINARHSLRALAAPLSLTETGVPPTDILFAGGEFAAGQPVEATYQFNSWRVGYRYRFHDGDRWSWWTGFTAKVRDAKIELSQGTSSARKTDVGFVPLLHIEGLYRLSDRWKVVLDADALAGGPGRAEDASLKIYRDIGERWSVAAGYRTVEGGADVDEVYNFAWLHYAVLSVSYDL